MYRLLLIALLATVLAPPARAAPPAKAFAGPRPSPPPAPPQPAPLTAAERAIFWQSPEDPPAEVRNTMKKENEGQHFLTCDEWNLHLFAPHLKNLGGGYAGVGTDQAYLFIGWQRPSLAWLTDYDPWVVRMHKIYAALFRAADSPQAMRKLWQPKGRADARAAIQARWPQDPELPKLLAIYDGYRVLVSRRLERASDDLREAKVASWLTDADTYSYVRALIEAGRVRPMLANLLETRALRGIGDVGRKLGVPLRTLYLSNAEEYWAYPQSYRDNIAALHFDASSWIARTMAAKPTNRDYRYNLQPALAFQKQVVDPKVKKVYHVVPWVLVRDETHFPLTVMGQERRRGRTY